ncbi:ABC transporter ATP-binding protein [Pseudonocardia phyllosphaerae]|uniref:ABC transporter ATP-binding protein n=1 Tax=Pseudonocardia phyllosphaerae TaxID=3390502 RepID=UPI00397B3116
MQNAPVLDPRAAAAPTPDPVAARLHGVSCGFGRRQVLDRIDLEVPMGAVLGLLGPNGAGKTTLLRTLLGLITPDAGTVELLGRPLPARAGEVLPHVGVLLDAPALHRHRTARQNLLRCAALEPLLETHRIPGAVDATLQRVGLAGHTDRRVQGYSLGMRQRLALAVPLLARRRLVVLDEPTNGLDPAGTLDVRRLIGEMNASGATVVVSSHLLGEIEATCSHVAVLQQGRLIAAGELRALLSGGPSAVVVSTPDAEHAVRALQSRGIDAETGPDRKVHVAPGPAAPDVVALLVHAGVAVHEVTRAESRLEEVFARLTRGPAPDPAPGPAPGPPPGSAAGAPGPAPRWAVQP